MHMHRTETKLIQDRLKLLSMSQLQVIVQAASEAAPELQDRIQSNLGRQGHQDLQGLDLLQVSNFLTEHMLRSEINQYRNQLIVLRDQGQLTGSSELEKHWIASLHLKNSADLYNHIQTLKPQKLKELYQWLRQQERGSSPPTNPVRPDGSIAADQLVDMAIEALTDHQMVEFMAKSLH